MSTWIGIGRSETGLVRASNQDAFAVMDTTGMWARSRRDGRSRGRRGRGPDGHLDGASPSCVLTGAAPQRIPPHRLMC